MDVQTLTYLFVGGSFALYIGIAIWSRAGSTKDFYVAGGGVSPIANGAATAADWMSAASFISRRIRHPTEIFSPPALTVPVRNAVAPDRIEPPPSSTCAEINQ